MLARMNPPGSAKRKAAAAMLLFMVATFIAVRNRPHDEPHATASANEPASTPSGGGSSEAGTRRADFDFYLLAMSVHAAFCADGHDRKSECQAQSPRPLVIHGLWPEKLEPRTYPHDCAAPALALEPALERALAPLMPGMRSGLHAHEWRTHGSCSGLDDDVYFSRALALAQHLDAAFRAKLTVVAGGETTAEDLRSVANLFEPGLGATLTFHCRTLRDAPERGRPYLIEVRQCLDDDGPNGAPGTAIACESVRRRDQGCGSSFLIAQ